MIEVIVLFLHLTVNSQPIVIEIEEPSESKIVLNIEGEAGMKKRVEKMVGYFGEVVFGESGIPISVKRSGDIWEVVVYKNSYTFKGAEDVVAKKVADIIAEKVLGRRRTFASMIAYTQGRTGSRELYISEVDGSRSMKISQNCKLSFSPSWAPDGKRIIFVCYMRKKPDIFVVDLQNGIMKPFITTESFEATPAFSPDGNFILYSSSKDGNIDLFKYNLNDGSSQRLTNDEFIDVSPSISPDGKSVAFTSNRDGNPGVFIMDLRNKTIRRITPYSTYATTPRFSPDGGRIAYTVFDGRRTYIEIYEFKSRITYRVSPEEMSCEGGNFSPSGELFVTSCKENEGRYGIYIIDTKTGRLTSLFGSVNEEVKFPAWSPYLW